MVPLTFIAEGWSPHAPASVSVSAFVDNASMNECNGGMKNERTKGRTDAQNGDSVFFSEEMWVKGEMGMHVGSGTFFCWPLTRDVLA